MSCIARIEKLENGFTVEVIDVKQQAENQKPKAAWKDPWKEYAFSTKKEVTDFLTKTLDTLVPKDESYGTAFNEAVAEKD